MKQIIKEKQKESEDLENVRVMEANEDLIKLKNEIARVKASKFVEKHLAFEKFQNEDFRWMYHDGEGNYFEADDNMQWNQVESPAIAFNERKLETIKNLQQQYNNLQKNKEADFNDKYSSIIKVKERVLLEEQEREKAELDKANKEKIQQEKQEQKAKQKKQRAKKAAQEAKAKKEKYVETHPANETWLGDDNKYYYHDGNGNYFTTNENNEWVACAAPQAKAAATEEPAASASSSSGYVETHPANETFTGPDGKYYYHDGNGNYFTTNENNEWVASTPPTTEATATASNSSSASQVAGGQKANEPYQDANGTWWYFDEQGNYFYGDGQGQWVQYKGEQ